MDGVYARYSRSEQVWRFDVSTHSDRVVVAMRRSRHAGRAERPGPGVFPACPGIAAVFLVGAKINAACGCSDVLPVVQLADASKRNRQKARHELDRKSTRLNSSH